MLLRGKKILRFRRLVLDTLVYATVCDSIDKKKELYDISKATEYMWSFEKMVYSFWIKDNRKMFYNREVYDYISPHFEFVASDLGQQLMEGLYRYWYEEGKE